MTLNELEVRKQYQIEITNRFAALVNISSGVNSVGFRRTLKKIFKKPTEKILGPARIKAPLIHDFMMNV